MSTKCEIVEIESVEPHDNADRLEIVRIGAYPCIVKKDEFCVGDEVIYIPVDMEVPTSNPLFGFLNSNSNPKDYVRIRACKLRGIFSMGLIIPIPDNFDHTKTIEEQLDIHKWEPPIESESTYSNIGFDRDYQIIPKYDIENLRKYPNLFDPDQYIIVTEKIHGTNASYVYSTQFDKFLVKSRSKYRLYDENDIYWRIAIKYNLEEICRNNPDIVIFGEIYGNVQKLKYGLHDKIAFMCFDLMNLKTRKFFDYHAFLNFVRYHGIDKVPELYQGNYINYNNIKDYAEGKSTLTDDHIREGIVVKPIFESVDDEIGRRILKLHGEGYLVEN